MELKPAWDFFSMEQMELNRRKLAWVRWLFIFSLPVLLLCAVGESSFWIKVIRRPLSPLVPSVEDLKKPLMEIPSLALLPALFETQKTDAKIKTPAAETPAVQVATDQVQWKLKGVLLAGTPRASLEDPKTQQMVWVSEGDQLGNIRVKKVNSNSVLLEMDGREYEIRM